MAGSGKSLLDEAIPKTPENSGTAVTGSVNRMVTTIQEIAGNNLAIDDMEVSTDDEIGKASEALNSMKTTCAR